MAYSTDPTLWLYTSLSSGSSHIVTATSRLETILKANKIAFRATDVATDEKARMLWGRRAGKRKLPGLVRMGMVVADLEEVEEWNEYGEIQENLGPERPPAAAPPTSTVPSSPPPTAAPPAPAPPPAKKEAAPGAAPAPKVSFAKSQTVESAKAAASNANPLQAAMQQIGFEAAERASKAKFKSRTSVASTASKTEKKEDLPKDQAEEAKSADDTKSAEDVKPVESTKSADDVKPVDTTKSADEVKPGESTKAADDAPVDTKPADDEPVATKPAGTEAADTEPADTKPADTEAVETKPAGNEPVDTKSEAETKADGPDAVEEKKEADAAEPAAAAAAAEASKPAADESAPADEAPATSPKDASATSPVQPPEGETASHHGSSISVADKEEVKATEVAAEIEEEPVAKGTDGTVEQAESEDATAPEKASTEVAAPSEAKEDPTTEAEPPAAAAETAEPAAKVSEEATDADAEKLEAKHQDEPHIKFVGETPGEELDRVKATLSGKTSSESVAERKEDYGGATKEAADQSGDREAPAESAAPATATDDIKQTTDTQVEDKKEEEEDAKADKAEAD